MSNESFRPTGPTVTVDGTPRQVASSTQTQHLQYRIRNVNAVAAYFTWNTPNISAGSTTAPTGMSATAPVAGTPAPNVIGMLPSSVEVFTLPSDAWFVAGAGTFEVTPGEGI